MEIKEFLEKQTNGEYVLICSYRKECDDWIEIPEDAQLLSTDGNGNGLIFWKDDFNLIVDLDDFWEKVHCNFNDFFSEYPDSKILWQRPQQPEELPFIDDEVQSLNDQYAEIEQVRQQSIKATLAERQSTYGSFEDVAFATENIINVLKKCNYDSMPHTHRMAMYMIASKMARIVNGDFNHLDSWHDIGGYAKLIENLIKESNNG